MRSNDRQKRLKRSRGDSIVLSRGSFSPLGSAHSLRHKDGARGVVDVVLRGSSDVERGNVDHLLADSDVSLSQEDTGVVHRLSHVLLHEHSLEASLEELVKSQTENVIKGSLAFLEKAELHDSSNQSVTFELPPWVVLIEGEQLTSSLSEFGQTELDSPDFSLASETELADDLELTDQSIPIERLSRGLGGFLVVSI